MLVRTFPLAVASALILTACGDQSPPNAPLPRIIAPKANAAMNPVTVCGGVTTMPVGECETLVEIYNDLDGAWMDQIDWPTKADPCTWTRVVCADGDHGSVVELNMHQAGLWLLIVPLLPLAKSIACWVYILKIIGERYAYTIATLYGFSEHYAAWS